MRTNSTGWDHEEHIGRLLAVPGFLSAGRYRALRGGPKYLAMYELEDHNVLRSAAFIDTVRYQPSERRLATSPSTTGRNFLLNGYRRIFPARTHPAENPTELPRYLQMGRIDIMAAMEEEFNDWYNTCYIPGFLTVPGVIRARRFTAIEAQPKYLTVYEFENPGVPDSKEWMAAGTLIHGAAGCVHGMRLDAGSPARVRADLSEAERNVVDDISGWHLAVGARGCPRCEWQGIAGPLRRTRYGSGDARGGRAHDGGDV